MFPNESDTPHRLSEAEAEATVPRPSRYLKNRCSDGGCGEHGGNVDLVLVDGSNERVIATRQSTIGTARLVGENVVWSTFGPYGMSGGLFRASAVGGPPVRLWDGPVSEVFIDDSDLYFSSSAGVVWVDLNTDKNVVLDEGSRANSFAVNEGRVFWSDSGQPSEGSKPSGRILSAPRHGGALVTHASQQPWPNAIAVDGKRIYWGARDRTGVWSVPVAGGDVTQLVAEDDGSCGGVVWLHRTGRGLLFIRAKSFNFRFGAGGEMWYVAVGAVAK